MITSQRIVGLSENYGQNLISTAAPINIQRPFFFNNECARSYVNVSFVKRIISGKELN